MSAPSEEVASKNRKNGDVSDEVIVLVTGGSGLVGRAIESYVNNSPAVENEKWIFLGSKDGDVRSRKDTEALFEKYKPTHVIHLAAKVGGLYANMKQKVTATKAFTTTTF